jgi:hypothetical protein
MRLSGVLINLSLISSSESWAGQVKQQVVKEKLAMLFRRFVLFAGNLGRNRNYDEVGSKFEWPYVMNSSVAMHGPAVSGTWIWHRQHAGWHHGYYRTRR